MADEFCDGEESMRREIVRLFQKLVSRKRDTFAVGIDWMKPFWVAAEVYANEVIPRKINTFP